MPSAHSSSTITSIAFSPDGTLLATGSGDKTTKLWRVADGARLLFAWHGTSSDRGAVCCDGPRSLRTTDCGYFGAGSYFALEAEYALRYSRPLPLGAMRTLSP